MSDAPNWYLTCELAESLLKNVLASPGTLAAHFPDPEFFPLRVATMCDLNNSLTNRRSPVFDYTSAATRTWPRDMSLVCDKETTVSERCPQRPIAAADKPTLAVVRSASRPSTIASPCRQRDGRQLFGDQTRSISVARPDTTSERARKGIGRLPAQTAGTRSSTSHGAL